MLVFSDDIAKWGTMDAFVVGEGFFKDTKCLCLVLPINFDT